MPSYFYTAISQGGEKISGVENAKSERDLAQVLRQKGYILTTVKEESAKSNSFTLNAFLDQLGKVSLTEKLVFVRNLKVMISAGVSLPRSLSVLSSQAKSKKFQKTIHEMEAKVLKGNTLSEAMLEHPKVFTELFVNMIRAGEESGTLEEVLSYLTLQVEREHEIRARVKGALMYPAVIVTAMIGVGAFMLAFIVPKLAETFEDLEVELPFSTKLIIAIGTFLSEKWYIALAAVIFFVFFLLRFTRTAFGKKMFDAGFLHFPIISGIVRKMQAALTTRTLSSLLAAGVPLVQTLEITSRILGNWYFRDALSLCAKQVQKGAKLSESLKSYLSLYPLMVVQMVEVGEETGETTEVLKKVAEFFEEEINNVTKNLISIIEPLLMIIVGVMVGFFAVAMFQPIYSMLGSIQ